MTHDPSNKSCPINADPRNESCDCDRSLDELARRERDSLNRAQGHKPSKILLACSNRDTLCRGHLTGGDGEVHCTKCGDDKGQLTAMLSIPGLGKCEQFTGGRTWHVLAPEESSIEGLPANRIQWDKLIEHRLTLLLLLTNLRHASPIFIKETVDYLGGHPAWAENLIRALKETFDHDA